MSDIKLHEYRGEQLGGNIDIVIDGVTYWVSPEGSYAWSGWEEFEHDGGRIEMIFTPDGVKIKWLEVWEDGEWLYSVIDQDLLHRAELAVMERASGELEIRKLFPGGHNHDDYEAATFSVPERYDKFY